MGTVKSKIRIFTTCLILSWSSVFAGPLDETRCCTVPQRNVQGEIIRRADVLAAFKKAWPCPSTHKTSGPCPGWIMDHVVSLACGGADSVANLQWLPVALWKAKSLWERKVYGGHHISPGCP